MTERSPIKLTRREFLQKGAGAIAALLSYLFLGKPRPVRADQDPKEKLDPPVTKAVEVFKSIKDVLDTEEKLGIIKSLAAYSEGSILIGAEGAENNDPSLPIIATIVEEGEEKYLEVIEREKNQTIIRINLKAFGLENVSIDSVKPRPTGENLLITYHRDGITEYHKYGLKESKSIRLKDGEKKSFLFTAGDRVCFGDKTGSYAVVESIRNNELNTYIEMTTGDQASAGSGGINVNLSQVAAKDKNDHLNTLTYRLAIAKSMDQARNYYYCTNGSSFGYYDDNGWPCIAIDA